MIKKPKGTRDIFGKEMDKFLFIKNILFEIASFYNFKFVETPIIENSDLFNRAVGSNSEIVFKQMYQFADKKGRLLVLRPEATASITRFLIENKMTTLNQELKLCYFSKMYRYERPQHNRYREFHQFGVEYLGKPNILQDITVILMATTILETFKIDNYILEINSLGDGQTIRNYSTILSKYFQKHLDQITPELHSRINTNPFRILDDKIEQKKLVVKNAPSITDYYSKENYKELADLCQILDLLEVKYKINPKLVRGLDYYSNIVFEFVNTDLETKSQNTIIAGGRYNHLSKQLDGPEVGGVGFAIGVERLINLLSKQLENEILKSKTLDIYICNISETTTLTAFTITYMLRQAGFKVEFNNSSGKLKKLFQLAERENPNFIIIIGPKEIALNKVIVKKQTTREEQLVSIDNLIFYLKKAGENEKSL